MPEDNTVHFPAARVGDDKTRAELGLGPHEPVPGQVTDEHPADAAARGVDPTVVPVTEEQYNDAMSRHGTDEWTDRDAAVQGAWLAQNGPEGGEDVSAGTSSSTSESNNVSTSAKRPNADSKPVPTTGNRSEKDQKGSSTVRSTGTDHKA